MFRAGRIVVASAGVMALGAVAAVSAHAFISPGSLSILAAAMGSFVWGFAAVIAVDVVLFFRKSRWRAALLALSMAAMVAMAGAVAWRYASVKKMNAAQTAAPDENSLFDDVPLSEYEVDLNTMTASDMAGYRLIQIRSSLDPLVFVKGAGVVDETDFILIKDPAEAFANLDRFIAQNGIKKSDRLLIICHGGGSSGRLAIMLNGEGYNARFSMLTNLKSTSLVTTIYDKPKRDSGVVLLPYEWRSREVPDAYIKFGFIHPNLDLTPEERRHFATIDPEKFDPLFTKNFNIVCFSNLHCILTKYFLDDKGITEAKIYKYPLGTMKYRDWSPEEFEALKKWRRPQAK